MLSFRLTLFLMILTGTVWSQSISGLHIYSELDPFTHVFFGQPNDQGFQFITRFRVLAGESDIPPGLLLQLDHEGKILHIDTLRPYAYHFAHKVDSFLFLGAYHYYKYLQDSSTFVFEICDLRGNVIQSFSQDFFINYPTYTGVAQVNDSMYIFTQLCQYLKDDPTVVFYTINTHTLDVQKKMVLKGGIIGNTIKIDDKPTFLEWTFDLWLKDTTFVHTTAVNTDTTKASSYGTILPREDKPGWFGFGGCKTPSNVNGICMMALDDKLKVDKVDVLYHIPSENNSYFAAFTKSICKNGNAYYAAGIWNAMMSSGYFYNDTIPTQMVLAKYDLQLNRLWTKIVGGDRRYLPYEVHPTIQGGFMIAGGLRDNLDDFKIAPFTMFFDSEGDLVGTQEPTQGRYEFTIYGNPGREALRIMSRFEGRKVLLQVVNAMGQPMLHRYMTEGMNEFDTSYWPSGTYLMSITDERGEVLWSQPWIRVN